MTLSDLHKIALVEGVRGAWAGRSFQPVNAVNERLLAEAAVYEVLSALRANPAWAASLGIGERSQNPNERVR